jgi:hypothetical protein
LKIGGTATKAYPHHTPAGKAMYQILGVFAEFERFTESSYPHPGPGEAWGEAIKRAYLVDVNRAAEMIPRLGPEAVRGALTAIFEGVLVRPY